VSRYYDERILERNLTQLLTYDFGFSLVVCWTIERTKEGRSI
jgi:hypothetical protein